MTVFISGAARNAAADAITALVDAGAAGGKLQIRSGTQPAGPDATATGTLLAEVTLAATAFAASSGGSAALAGTPLSVTAVADGTATWFRILDSAGVARIDGSVGVSSADLVVNTTTVSTGLDVEITDGTLSIPASG
ncbi:hypothetical protein ACFWR9_11605 [Streptomyces sp. NPDC058534]|uniref:hypothetical protein n=1 Tax=Streptomyces sp. NPDC058534 TaxID=3346541 RepID=UPI003657EBD3